MAQTTAVMPNGPIGDVSQSHPHSNKLEDQAASAALYSKHDNINNKNGYDILDADHTLSSAGAAASLKYAQPHDLPSFPSTGLKKGDRGAAGAAASLGWANQKAFEHWKPDPSSSASAAAMLAKDYKMAPLWQPEQSDAGAKAALLAHRDGGKVEIWQPEQSAHGAAAALIAHRNDGKVEIWQPESTAWGSSAATQAMKKGNSLSPQLDYGHTALGRQGSLLAATGAMSSSRKRAESQPIVAQKPDRYPDESNAVANALSAATSAQRSDSRRSNISGERGSVPFTTMSREMFTSNPPVGPEVDELNRQNTLRASAVAMAKQMYNHQQQQIDAAKNTNAQSGASAAHGRQRSSVSSDDEVVPMRFNNLQEAAQKLAQERLAKLHDEHAQNREYRDYYTGETSPQKTYQQPQSRMSIRGRARRRASSEGTRDDDYEQSNRIRAQMSIFSSNLNQVDEKKRTADREALIAAAQRNVKKNMHTMDEKVFADTGKVAPSLLSEWEVKAHAAAQAKSDVRMENYGKVNIGGGKWVNQSAVDLAAARNVQPVLDEINEKAAIEHERRATIAAEQETERRKTAERKTREKEEKEINKKLKRDDKAEKKAQKEEEKRLAKENRKSTGAGVAAGTGAAALTAEEFGKKESAADESPEMVEPVVAVPETVEPDELHTTNAAAEEDPQPQTIAERREPVSTPAHIRTSMEDQSSLRMRENADAANPDISTPLSPSSPESGGKVKNWLKTKFNRRSSKAQKPTATQTSEKEPAPSFVGGAALTGASANNSTVSVNAGPSSGGDVALEHEEPSIIAEPTMQEERGRKDTRETQPVSPISDVAGGEPEEEEEEFEEARDNFDEDLAPPPTFSTEKESSPARTAKFTEEI